ncbi:MAG TPA: proline dehydrogenase family protein [Bryobacteraceae bacterium]|nr:proline dehydrogenase family protein [Bryobacteraceae bacterium]
MLRSLLLYLSRQPWLRHWTETSPAADRLTSRFIAGHTLEREIAVCQRLNRDGYLASLDHLGESVTSLEEAQSSRDAYLSALDRIAELGLQATVSVKLTQLGLDFSQTECEKNVDQLVRRAAEIGSAVEVDMESSAYVDRTLALVEGLHQRYGHVRAVIQAYLYRSHSDVENLCRLRIPVRLCKGAYKEPSDVAFPRKQDVDRNYVLLMQTLLRDGVNPAIASHDQQIVQRAIELVKEQKLGADRFEFQMLYGISRDLQRRLTGAGYRLRLYVPYGDAWYPYFMRRLAERPANVLFLVRNLLKS